MKLIHISPNVLVNPEHITCIEQKEIRGIDVVYVWLGNKSYVLEKPLNELYEEIGIAEQSEGGQFFAG